MKQFKCEICGGTSIFQIDERTYECQACGLQYDVAEVEKLIVLPKVVEELVELTVEEQKNSQPTFDVPQELEDNFTEEVEAEQETEEIAVETDSETFLEYIEDTSMASAESEETDNSTVIEESQSEVAEETADEISIVELEIDGIEDVVSENEDKSEETEADEQKEAVKSNAIIPWYKNKKIIIPSIAGIALALVTVVLLIVLMPKENIPVSDNNSSDMSSDTSAVESDVSSENESVVESDVSSVTESTETPSTNGQSTASKPQQSSITTNNADPNVVTSVRYNQMGKIDTELNAYGYRVKEYGYHLNGNISSVSTIIYNSSCVEIKAISFHYLEDGTKSQYYEFEYNEGDSQYHEYYYTTGVHKGKVSEKIRINGGYGDIYSSSYYECTKYEYFSGGSTSSEHTIKYLSGVFSSSKEIRYYEFGGKSNCIEYDSNGNVIKEIFYDENGNEIQS